MMGGVYTPWGDGVILFIDSKCDEVGESFHRFAAYIFIVDSRSGRQNGDPISINSYKICKPVSKCQG